MKKLFQSKFAKKILGPTARGLLKQVPIIGTPAAEFLTNLTLPKGEKKHSNMSMIVQWVCVGVLVLSFFMKWITLEDLLNWLGYEPPLK